MRSERSDNSNFPIKCIYNLNILNRKSVKYSQMHTIDIFKHIFTKWINTKSTSFSVVPHHFSQNFFIDVLCKSVYVLGLLLLHILRTLAPKRIVQWWKVWRIWWPMMLRVPRDDLKISIAQITNIVRWHDSLLHLVETNILFLLHYAWRFAILCPSKLSPCKLPHLPIHQTI